MEEVIRIETILIEGLQPHKVKKKEQLREMAIKRSTNRRGTDHSWVVSPQNYWEIHEDCSKEQGTYVGFPVVVSIHAKKNRLVLVSPETIKRLYPETVPEG